MVAAPTFQQTVPSRRGQLPDRPTKTDCYQSLRIIIAEMVRLTDFHTMCPSQSCKVRIIRFVIGAIGFLGLVLRMSFTDMEEYIPITKAIAKQLSEHLGYTA